MPVIYVPDDAAIECQLLQDIINLTMNTEVPADASLAAQLLKEIRDNGSLTPVLPTGTPYSNAIYDPSGDLSYSFELYDSSGFVSLNTDYRILVDSGNFTSIDYGTRNLRDSYENYSIDYESRFLQDSTNGYAIDYQNRIQYNSSGQEVINWEYSQLIGNGGTVPTVLWADTQLADLDGITSLDWQGRYTRDSSGNASIDWENRIFHDIAAVPACDYSSRQLYDDLSNTICDFSTADRFTIIGELLYLRNNNVAADEPHSTNVVPSPIRYYGDEHFMLGAPEQWIKIELSGGVFVGVPAYTLP